MEKLLGIIEVRGSFLINIIKNDGYSSGYSISQMYSIQSIDYSLLEYIKDELDKLDISVNITHNLVKITRKKDIRKFIEIINSNPFISDRRSKEFKIWTNVADMIDQEMHLFDIKKIFKQKEKLLAL